MNIGEQKNNKLYELTIKSFAIVGFFAVLFFIVWGATFLIKNAPAAISKISSAAVTLTSKFFPANTTDKIEFELSKNTISNDGLFNAYVDYPGKKRYEEGSFEISYTCAENVELKRIARSNTPVSFSCGDKYKLNNGAKAISLKTITENKDDIELNINLYFTEKGDDSPIEIITQSIIVLKVKERVVSNEKEGGSDDGNGSSLGNQGGAGGNYEITEGERSENNYNLNDLETNEGSNRFKQADLAGEILEFGYIDEDTKEFNNSTEIPRRSQASAKFKIENIGTKETEHWSFSLVLPTEPKRIFRSDSQRPLNPGERIEYTIGFDKFIKNSNQTFTLNIDPTRSVNEKSKDNNIIKQNVTFTTASSTESD